MCTLTILPRSDSGSTTRGARLAFNRDEQRTRTPGTDPELEHHDRCQALLPRDPEGGGTWIAASDRGLVFALLNVNPTVSAVDSSGGASRGSVIPGVLSAESLQEVERRLPPLVSLIQRPFRLVVTDGSEILEAVGGSGAVECLHHPLDRPFMRCSSGLGDAIVAPLRTEAFDQTFSDAVSDLVAAQDTFHRLRFSDHDECSIDMSRKDAFTVSWTVVELNPLVLRMIHHSAPPRANSTPSVLQLSLRSHSDSPTGAVVE